MIKFYPEKNIFRFLVSALFIITLLNGCKKNVDEGPLDPSIPPDLTTKVRSSVSGFVTDENNQAVNLANVQVGTLTTSTDKYGYFEVKNVDVVKEAAVVTITKTGYFKGIRTYIAAEGKSAFFRIKLISKTIAGTINGTSGGIITLANGLSISIPTNAVVNAASNTAYTGTVNVAAYWINPTSADLTNTMPGDLRGINTDGNLKLLTTYGMAAVELTGSGGELLQIATGKKVSLNFPIPVSLSSSAPATIPLWYFDEAKGLWKEEGTAKKTGNTYSGEVSHFSYWNCDIPSGLVQFNCTLVNQNGQPIQYAYVKISRVSNLNSWGAGYTDISGYTGGAVPNNTQFKMEVFTNAGCINGPIYSQVFTTTTLNISLGTITINTAAFSCNVSGSVTNCSNTALTNGYLILNTGNQYSYYPVSNGTYNFNITLCSIPATVSIHAQDNSNGQQSPPVNYVLNSGNNALPNIQACGTSTEFINYSLNGTPYFYSLPADTMTQQVVPVSNYGLCDFIRGYKLPNLFLGCEIAFTHPTTLPVNYQPLLFFYAREAQESSFSIPGPVMVQITEYGNVGLYISGNFSGVVKGNTSNTLYNVSCSFRIKRGQ